MPLAAGTLLHGFAYGEHLEGPQQRSLGFRLLAPASPPPWGAEVEALARRLQAAPYPDHWPAADLFCSVLLRDGGRLVAVARYGLTDHTPSHRRSGLELVGVVGPGHLNVPEALALYQWLRQRRADCADLTALGEACDLGEALTTAPAVPPVGDPVPVLPIQLWQDGALLFAATTPSDPDLRLGVLTRDAGPAWQWLPLVGGDFPLANYAQRGPLVAWTPHLAGVAVKLDRPAPLAPAATAPRRPRTFFARLIGLLALLLLGANLWATLDVRRHLPTEPAPAPAPPPAPPVSAPTVAPDAEEAAEQAREQLAQAVYRQLARQGVFRDHSPKQLREEYERLAARDGQLRVKDDEAKQAIGALALLARRSPSRVEAVVREAGAKGFDPELVNLLARRVHDRLTEHKERP